MPKRDAARTRVRIRTVVGFPTCVRAARFEAALAIERLARQMHFAEFFASGPDDRFWQGET
jgi:hypothetical protein